MSGPDEKDADPTGPAQHDADEPDERGDDVSEAEGQPKTFDLPRPSTWSDRVPRPLGDAIRRVRRNTPSGAERRRTPRRELEVPLEVYGYDAALSLVHAYGSTINVSAGGLFAQVDVGLPVGARAVVAMRPDSPGLAPRIFRGRVVRSEGQQGNAGIAIQFDTEDRRL